MLLEKLGNPHLDLNVILVGGTNGKGSTATMISSILQEASFKVGQYSSPHLIRFTERFRVNGEEILKKDIEKIFDQVKPHITDQTYFEIITVMAYLYFKEEEVDFAIMEVGMGGRLDATNVVDPMVSVITNVSLEHTQHLGKTVEAITFEKAGIIREGGYAVTAAEGEALEILQQIAMKRQATLLVATPTGLELGLMGEFQKTNAGIAIKTTKSLKHFGVEIPKIAFVNGLSKARWPGRFELFRRNIIMDCAHNVAGVEILMEELTALKEDYEYEKMHLVFGAMEDKDYKSMISILEPMFDKIIFTRPLGERGEMKERSADPKVMAKLVDDHKKVIILESPTEAFKKAKSLTSEEDLMVVCGSCFLVGDLIRG